MTHSLFEEPWWLDAAAPGAWGAAEVERGGRVVARLPYVVVRRRLGDVLTQPALTATLGPWVAEGDGKYSTRLGAQKELMSELIARLPSFLVFRQNFSPQVTNTLPFQWAGFRTSVRYTYRFDDLTDLDAVWAEVEDRTRRQVRKAQKLVEVEEGTLDEFLRLNALTFRRQGMTQPSSDTFIRRLDAAAAERGARRILRAVDAEGRTHASVYLVYDERAAYYLMGGRDDALSSSGATSLLLWEAIRFAASVSRAFDFEGSMIESIERFFRSFGARQMPYYQVEKVQGVARTLHAARDLARALARR